MVNMMMLMVCGEKDNLCLLIRRQIIYC